MISLIATSYISEMISVRVLLEGTEEYYPIWLLVGNEVLVGR